LPQNIQVARDGRLALTLNAGKPTSSVAIYSADLAKVHVVEGVSIARLVDGDGVVAVAPKSRIVGQVGDAPVGCGDRGEAFGIRSDGDHRVAPIPQPGAHRVPGAAAGPRDDDIHASATRFGERCR
jgi:hypothetical protein